MSPQGKRRKPAPARPPERDHARARRLGLIGFGVAFIAVFAIAAVAIGIGHPEVPSDAIAVVEDAPNGTIPQDEFDAALRQTALGQGLKSVPASDDPQYEQFAQAAESNLIVSRWIEGEAEDRGVEVSEREVDQEIEKTQQQYGGEQGFLKAIRDAGFTLDEARNQLRLGLITDRIQSQVLPTDQPPDVTDNEIKTYYEANAPQFETPESRDVREILTKSEADAQKALTELQQDDSPKSWATLANKYSVDEATKANGGLRAGVVEGQSEPALDAQIFSAPQGELVGPFKTDAGYYVIQVEKVAPAKTTSLEDATETIKTTLQQQRQQETAQAFQLSFESKWIARTICADDYLIDRCSNYEPPQTTCDEKTAESQGCNAPVSSRGTFDPGTVGVFGSAAPTMRPQGPVTPQSQAPAGTLPPGLVPGGAVPPGTAPPTTAP